MLSLNTINSHETPAMIMNIVQQTNGTYEIDRKVEIFDPRGAQKFNGCIVMTDSRIVVARKFNLLILNEDLETIHEIDP